MKRLFYVCRKVIFSIPFSKASRLLSEAPLCGQCFGSPPLWTPRHYAGFKYNKAQFTNFFYVYRKVIFSISFSKAKRLLSEAPLCEACFGFSIHWPMIVSHLLCDSPPLCALRHYQASNKKNPLQQCDGFFAVWGLVNSQEAMPNSVVKQNSAKASPDQ